MYHEGFNTRSDNFDYLGVILVAELWWKTVISPLLNVKCVDFFPWSGNFEWRWTLEVLQFINSARREKTLQMSKELNVFYRYSLTLPSDKSILSREIGNFFFLSGSFCWFNSYSLNNFLTWLRGNTRWKRSVSFLIFRILPALGTRTLFKHEKILVFQYSIKLITSCISDIHLSFKFQI